MQRRTWAVGLTSVSLLSASAVSAPGEAPEIYAIVVDAAGAGLPQELHGFFAAHRDALLQAVSETAATTAAGLDGHYVLLDVAAKDRADDDRRAAAAQFPQEREAALQLYAKHKAPPGGTLPWALHEQYRAVVAAMRTAKTDEAVRAAGALLHFAADAALPRNTTATGWIDASAGRRSAAATRFQIELARFLHERLAYEVRVWPGRCRAGADVRSMIFETLLDAHRSAADIAALYEHAGGGDGPWNETVAARLEERLEAGALLGARLIVSAWVSAGRPELAQEATAAPTDAAPTAAAQERPVDPRLARHAFVGSSGSTVVRRVSCSHAARIKPENCIFFDSAAEARRAGRTACKACDPYDNR